jgi:hypothetical protein
VVIEPGAECAGALFGTAPFIMFRSAAARPQLLVVDDEIPVLKVIEHLAARVG